MNLCVLLCTIVLFLKTTYLTVICLETAHFWIILLVVLTMAWHVFHKIALIRHSTKTLLLRQNTCFMHFISI